MPDYRAEDYYDYDEEDERFCDDCGCDPCQCQACTDCDGTGVFFDLFGTGSDEVCPTCLGYGYID